MLTQATRAIIRLTAIIIALVVCGAGCIGGFVLMLGPFSPYYKGAAIGIFIIVIIAIVIIIIAGFTAWVMRPKSVITPAGSDVAA